VTVLFHPDCNRRLRSCTESADPCPITRSDKALAGLDPRIRTLTAGGDFHPALRTSAARLDGLDPTMPGTGAPGKRLERRGFRGAAMRGRHGCFRIGCPGLAWRVRIKLQILKRVAWRDSDSGLFSSRNHRT